MKLSELLEKLNQVKIESWFDLGIFLDRFRNERSYPGIEINESFESYLEHVRTGGVAFLTFQYMIDGVSVEAGKYASLFRKQMPGIPVHFIAGEIQEPSFDQIPPDFKLKLIPDLAGFDHWDLYQAFFFQKLERGGELYNTLIRKLWDQTLRIIKVLGQYVEEEEIRLFFVINVCSNPGNVAYALALALLSESLGIPVINNNHDFYWEGGSHPFMKKKPGQKAGARDFFFNNYEIGEVFSLIEMLYPWQSRTWLQVNINRAQSEHLVKLKGQNPANVMEIGTAVDLNVFSKKDKRRNIQTFLQLEKVLSRYKKGLMAYSVDDLLEEKLVDKQDPQAILIGARTDKVERFTEENIILLQPTRIIARKRIEGSFRLLLKMFQEEEMYRRFKLTSHLKMTLLISGPVAAGHFNYFITLLEKFRTLLEKAEPGIRGRIYLAFLFGELDQDRFLRKFDSPAGINDLYSIASLVLLPSKTEGRGLPIIEASACGTPIFCRRYEPESVYAEVIGEHLEEKDRLKVLEFKGKNISKSNVQNITERVFFPHRFKEEFRHNRRVVHKRYSMDSLGDSIYEILERLHMQIGSNEKNLRILKEELDDYRERLQYWDDNLDALLDTQRRNYMAGYGKLSFMLMLKSLIDPSHFRVEQELIRGMTFHFARSIIVNDPDMGHVPEKMVLRFYNAVETIFEFRQGEHRIQHDHSMAYRHRNRTVYPYQELTFQELTGLVNLLYIHIVQPSPINKVDLSPQFFTDWNLALLQLTGSSYLAIDNRDLLIDRLKKNLPIAYFPGAYIMYELEFFALQSIRSRLGLDIEETLQREMLEKEGQKIKPVYIFAQEKNLGKQLNKDEIIDYILQGNSEELKLLYEYQLIRIISTKQVCVGIHFVLLGQKALKILRKIRDEGGYLLTNRSNAAMMTDIVDMDRFHVGKVYNEFTAHLMGIPVESGYIQYVPASLRASLSYPVPVQTAKEFDEILKSSKFQSLLKSLGETKVMQAIRDDARSNGSPLKHVLKAIEKGNRKEGPVRYRYLCGRYEDGQPYNGALACLDLKKHNWAFRAVDSPNRPETVLQISKDFQKHSGKKVEIAWNGGYILNPELVGKLGIPESYIGSPLGLIVSGGCIYSPPLFNKAAFLIYRNGKADIKRVNLDEGLQIKWKDQCWEFGPADCNRAEGHSPAFFDLRYQEDDIPARGRTLLRLSGNRVREIKRCGSREKTPLIPAGLTLMLDPVQALNGMQAGDQVEIQVPGLENIQYAVEAGPLLLDRGLAALDMQAEGWKSRHSIRTQAARLDYTDMRGPKIAVGMDEKDRLMVLAINGRIRESVGASHGEMADMLKEQGMLKAMGFDPGGSSTLVVGEKCLNISPYNKNYQRDVFALAPEPRAVSNAVLAYLEGP